MWMHDNGIKKCFTTLTLSCVMFVLCLISSLCFSTLCALTHIPVKFYEMLSSMKTYFKEGMRIVEIESLSGDGRRVSSHPYFQPWLLQTPQASLDFLSLALSSSS
jgi:hypothetical protein